MREQEALFSKAKTILQKNWVSLGRTQGFTKPSPRIYPFQWSWDSGFISYGYAHFDVEKGVEELRSLFKGQWINGMLPHIIFHKHTQGKAKGYFPGPETWNAQKASENAPENVATSGIVQPPLQAMGIWHLFKELSKKDRKKAHVLLEEFYPKLFAFHKYLHTTRDPEEWGLITIVHPWESGLDNSPRWDETLKRIESIDMSKFKRRDIEHTDPEERPTNETYGRYMKLMFELKERGYNANDSTLPFRIKDILFSSILYMANKRMKWIAEELNEDVTEIETWMGRFRKNFIAKCWNKDERMFFDLDLKSGKQIKIHTVAALMPMITGLLKEPYTSAIVELLNETNFCGQQACAVKLAPSTSISADHFRHNLYWRGPIWINVNWFLWKGFRECKMHEEAKELRDAMLNLIAKEGFREYFSPLTGKGLGAKNFSWTAALAIDLLHEK